MIWITRDGSVIRVHTDFSTPSTSMMLLTLDGAINVIFRVIYWLIEYSSLSGWIIIRQNKLDE